MKLSKMIIMALFATTRAQTDYEKCEQSETLERYIKEVDDTADNGIKKTQYDAKLSRKYVKKDGVITNVIASETMELFEYKKGKPCKGSLLKSTLVFPPVSNWKYEDNVCYNSQEKPSRASPNLRYCFGSTENACCNYIEDQDIGGVYSSFAPSPC